MPKIRKRTRPFKRALFFFLWRKGLALPLWKQKQDWWQYTISHYFFFFFFTHKSWLQQFPCTICKESKIKLFKGEENPVILKTIIISVMLWIFNTLLLWKKSCSSFKSGSTSSSYLKKKESFFKRPGAFPIFYGVIKKFFALIEYQCKNAKTIIYKFRN